jgi:8-oxo-dGTP diphosphatase
MNEKILRTERDLTWLPKPNECQLVLSSQPPPRELVGTALVLALMGDRLLMTELVRRGWDVPGGHVEAGEQPEETARREVYEETGATLGCLYPLGYHLLHLLGPRPQSYRYPYPVCYQVFYQAQVTALADFLPTAETRGRALFPPTEARALRWVQVNVGLYEAALAMSDSEERCQE